MSRSSTAYRNFSSAASGWSAGVKADSSGAPALSGIPMATIHTAAVQVERRTGTSWLRGDSEHDGRHVVIRRRVAAELMNGREDRVDDGLCRQVTRIADDLEQALGAELASDAVV